MTIQETTVPLNRPINVTEFIDKQPLSAFQVIIVALCFLIVAVDGFDTASIGFIAPAIRADWHLTNADLAPLFGAGLVGLMAGAFIFGPLADRFGRKNILVVSILFFGLASLASARSEVLWELAALRFLTGLGLGGAMPNAITLTSEFCPQRRVSFMVTTMFCGFTVGMSLGGLASAWLVEAYGWRSVLFVGGVLPIALAACVALSLPESVRYLVTTGANAARIRAILHRIAPKAELENATFAVSDRKGTHSPLAHLFRPEFLRHTLLFWLTFFMSLLVLYLLASWLPTVLRGAGLSLSTAALITAMLQGGGTAGAIILGLLMDRLNPYFVLATSYSLACVFIAAIGSLSADPLAAGAAVFCAGFCLSGAQVGVNALIAKFYPTDCRATGVGWANGVGRIGSVVGSVGGASMLAMGWGMPVLFAVIGLPALIAGIAMLWLGFRRPPVPLQQVAV
jgi:MFS transporter, AAHS family, 4-hydroxybenzoate transporter